MRAILRRWLDLPEQHPTPTQAPVGAPLPHDLRDQPVTFALLDDTHAWRERLVEELVIEDGDHIAVSSSYQMRLQPDLIRRFAPHVQTGDRVRLLVPLTTRPKDLLLGVDLDGPDGPCSLLLKSQIGRMQIRYLEWQSEQPIAPTLENLLYGMFTFSKGVWDHFREERRDRTQALATYLSDGIRVPITTADVDRITKALQRSQDLLLEALDEPVEVESLLNNLLLSLPFVEVLPNSALEIDAWITELNHFVDSAPPTVRALLAEYCVRWEVLVDVVVPVGEPFKIKLTTRRPWGSEHPARTTQRLAIGDAATAHIDLRVADHSVYIAKKPILRDLRGNSVAIPVVDELRYGVDTASIYVSNVQSRPYYVDLTVELGLRGSTRYMVWMLWALIAGAGVVSVVLPEGGELADGLALLVFPLTLAGTLVLTRATSGVAQRLYERSRRWLTFGIGLMWVIALVRLLAQDVDIGWLTESWAQLASRLW